jgi:hypothetical protein
MTRKQRHRRLSHLFTIDAHIPKLDVVGSSPISRSHIFNKLTNCPHPVLPRLPRKPCSGEETAFGCLGSVKARSGLVPRRVDFRGRSLCMCRSRLQSRVPIDRQPLSGRSPIFCPRLACVRCSNLEVHRSQSDVFQLFLDIPPQKIVAGQKRAALGRKDQSTWTLVS